MTQPSDPGSAFGPIEPEQNPQQPNPPQPNWSPPGPTPPPPSGQFGYGVPPGSPGVPSPGAPAWNQPAYLQPGLNPATGYPGPLPPGLPAKKTPGLATASLIVSLVSLVLCFAFVGSLAAVIMGAMAISRINNDEAHLTGRPVAIAGLIFGVLGILAGAGFWAVASSDVFSSLDSVSQTHSQGDCVQILKTNGEARLLSKPCSRSHEAEVADVVDVDDTTYPGEKTMKSRADTLCDAAFTAYVGIPNSQSQYAQVFIYPTAQTWSEGDRSVVCLVSARAGTLEAGTTRGSKR